MHTCDSLLAAFVPFGFQTGRGVGLTRCCLVSVFSSSNPVPCVRSHLSTPPIEAYSVPVLYWVVNRSGPLRYQFPFSSVKNRSAVPSTIHTTPPLIVYRSDVGPGRAGVLAIFSSFLPFPPCPRKGSQPSWPSFPSHSYLFGCFWYEDQCGQRFFAIPSKTVHSHFPCTAAQAEH